ncbi:hypothetical protein BR93DRAFT_162410 [Coniochaeta sp. PMI_546]|nr:hypothetical protein BR93DRAFT_162410 [Coniochaeta sp. PMI_546]
MTGSTYFADNRAPTAGILYSVWRVRVSNNIVPVYARGKRKLWRLSLAHRLPEFVPCWFLFCHVYRLSFLPGSPCLSLLVFVGIHSYRAFEGFTHGPSLHEKQLAPPSAFSLAPLRRPTSTYRHQTSPTFPVSPVSPVSSRRLCAWALPVQVDSRLRDRQKLFPRESEL